jgi:hypothetical protein
MIHICYLFSMYNSIAGSDIVTLRFILQGTMCNFQDCVRCSFHDVYDVRRCFKSSRTVLLHFVNNCTSSNSA